VKGAHLPQQTTQPDFSDKPIQEMTLVEIAGELELVTGWIEAQHVRERDARAAYEVVKREVDGNISTIKDRARRLFDQQKRKMNAFGGLLGYEQPASGGRPAGAMPPARKPGSKQNLADAICEIWKMPQYDEALTTEEISEALKEVGWTSNASPSSLRSSLNQAIGKLSRVGRLIRFKGDGTRLSIRDTKSRARKYIAAYKSTEVVED
jgi:hypothetical protein